MLKKDLEKSYEAAQALIVKQRESIRLLEDDCKSINKEVLEEKTESRRLRKVLDRAITAVDSRIATVSVVFVHTPDMRYQPEHQCSIDAEVKKPELQLNDEQKFLGFVRNSVLSDQYVPEKQDEFYRGFGY